MPTLIDSLTEAPGDKWQELQILKKIAQDTLQLSLPPPMTDHSFEHSERVEARAAELLQSTRTTESLNWYERYVLLLCCWFHDSGLIALGEGENPWDVRQDHGLRCRQYMEQYLAEHLSNFEIDLVCDISMTHVESDVSRLDEERYVELDHESSSIRLRPRLLACLLRVADACEISQGRVSWRVARHFQMNAESSRHWTRHFDIHSVRFVRKDSRVTISADATYATYESKKFIESAIDVLDQELALAEADFSAAGLFIETLTQRQLREREPATLLSWTVLPKSVYRLLTEGMYDSKTVFLRELIQNSLDAIHVRWKVLKDSVSPWIEVEILTTNGDLDDEAVMVIVGDNGIGMDAEDVAERLLRIGSSIRDSQLLAQLPDSEAARDELIARFGVGFVTVFAVANSVELITQKPEMRGLRVKFSAVESGRDHFSPADARMTAVDTTTLLGTRIAVRLQERLNGQDILDALRYYVRGGDKRNSEIRWRCCEFTHAISPSLAADRNQEGWRALILGKSIAPGEATINNNQETLTVLQEGILIEEAANDLLPKELRSHVGGILNCPAGQLELTAARHSFRREERTVAWMRRRLESEFIELQISLLKQGRRIVINRLGLKTQDAVRALLKWTFSERRGKRWVVRREEETLPFLAWSFAPGDRVISLVELLNRIEDKDQPIMLYRGRGWRTLEQVAQIGNVQLYASPTLPFETATQLAGKDVFLLEADQEDGESDAELCGFTILRTLLKHRGREMHTFQQYKGMSDFGAVTSQMSVGIRRVYDLLPEDNVLVNALDVSDFVILDNSQSKLLPVINLNSEKLRAIVHAISADNASKAKMQAVQAILMIAALRFNDAIDTMLDLADRLD